MTTSTIFNNTVKCLLNMLQLKKNLKKRKRCKRNLRWLRTLCKIVEKLDLIFEEMVFSGSRNFDVIYAATVKPTSYPGILEFARKVTSSLLSWQQ